MSCAPGAKSASYDCLVDSFGKIARKIIINSFRDIFGTVRLKLESNISL